MRPLDSADASLGVTWCAVVIPTGATNAVRKEGISQTQNHTEPVQLAVNFLSPIYRNRLNPFSMKVDKFVCNDYLVTLCGDDSL